MPPQPAVLGHGQVPAQVGGAVFTVQGLLGLAFVAVGVDHRGQVTPDAVQVGGVEPAGLLQQHGLAAAAHVVGQREPLDRLDQH